MRSTVETADGRSLSVYESGDPAGRPVVSIHGTPGTGDPFPGHVRLAQEQEIRLVSFDRAGYAASTRRAGRTVADLAADVEAIADALGIDRFVVWGHSGGGPHALACAGLLQGRVAAAASVSGVAPAAAAGLDWLCGMGEGNVQEFGAAQAGEAVLRPALEAEAAGLVEADVDGLVASLSSILCPEDVAALSGELGAYFVQAFATALSTGVDGWVDDDLAFVEPWGFELAAIATPVLIVHGRSDVMAPPGHSDWLAANVPGAEAWIDEGEGHLTVFVEPSMRRVHDWLLERL